MLRLTAIIAASAAVHAAIFVAVRGEPHPAPAPMSFVDIAIATPAPPPPPAPAATPTPPPAQQASRIAPRVSRTTAVAPRAIARTAAAPSAAEPPPPADFTGTTLTNDSGTGWAAPTGNGEPMDRPIAAPRPVRVQAPPSEGTTVPLADLSRAPRAPNLDAALVHNYPADARDRGMSGRAVVRARITAAGTAHVLEIVSESQAGFGLACRHTVDASRWEPPLDRTGRAVETLVTYTCRFEVGS